MILYNIVDDARKILIDTNSAAYRWSDSYFIKWFKECVNKLYSYKLDLFYDSRGNVTKGDYILTSPQARLTIYALGDYIHNSAYEMFECTTSGTTGATEPTWSLGYNATTSDGTATFTNIERSDLPFPDFTRDNLSAFLISRAYEIDSTDQNNYDLSQRYMQKFGDIL